MFFSYTFAPSTPSIPLSCIWWSSHHDDSVHVDTRTTIVTPQTFSPMH